MNGIPADFAVIGSTPFARFLAGLLAASHGRSVLHVGKRQSFYGLPRGLDLSVAPITRPESWAMLGEGRGETLKLLGRIAGRSAWSHVDPIFFTHAPRAAEALSHIRHMATGFGIAAESTAPSLLGPDRVGVTLRDAVRLNRPVLEPALDTWLERSGVRRLLPDTVGIAADGSATLRAGDHLFQARQAILADDEAIIAHLPPSQWPDLLRRHGAAAILARSAQPLAAPIMLEIHSGIALMQGQEGGVAAIGPGDMASFSGRIQDLLGRQRLVEQVGQTSFAALATRDGAPAFGRVGGNGADIIAGLGAVGVFLMPALARWLCDDAGPREAAWFGARLVSRTGSAPSVADFAPIAGSLAA